MKILKKRGQGATEYLLMLAAVLVIVAVAVFYILHSAPGGVAPSINATVTDIAAAPTQVKLSVTSISSTVTTGNWKYVVYQTTQPDWTTPTENLAAGQDYTLTIGEPVAGGAGTYTVKIFHVPTSSVMFQGNVQKS